MNQNEKLATGQPGKTRAQRQERREPPEWKTTKTFGEQTIQAPGIYTTRKDSSLEQLHIPTEEGFKSKQSKVPKQRSSLYRSQPAFS
jgi:hypothetical protein